MIDRQTVQRIIDAADIVEVVSDFVSLRRRGANYVGLCPFHNEKTPSFSVSRSKGICKCFSCGKGGSAVNFIMEHEQLSYYEALKYLANKYNIEVKEREFSEEEKQEQTARENMLVLNEFALKTFEENLWDSDEGKSIGLSYFYERGFNDDTIRKFRLGYSMEKKDDFYNKAIKAGYKDEYLFSTGLCVKSQYGGGYDRYKGRVMFPVFNIAGKVIAFGGRTLKNDPAKYVNSPESIIYKKSNELYGLFLAKRKIVENDVCYLVEGYTDVISMHQAGIENVVASSGTSLTTGQIRMIHRFTNNVTVIYDGDSAGIKASLRGIDMLLEEGLNIKVLLLPDGDDPDSFARKNSTSEMLDFIKQNEEDFIKFKIRILLKDAGDDPIKRSEVVSSIVRSIAVIPFQITKSAYAQECARMLNFDERVIAREIAKETAKLEEKRFEEREKAKREAAKNEFPLDDDTTTLPVPEIEVQPPKRNIRPLQNDNISFLRPYETDLLKYVIRYGMSPYGLTVDDATTSQLTVIEYIKSELDYDNITFSNEDLNNAFIESIKLLPSFRTDQTLFENGLNEIRKNAIDKGIQEIRETAENLSDASRREENLISQIDLDINAKRQEFERGYIEKFLCSHEQNGIRQIAANLVSEKYSLSKMHTKHATIPSEYSRLEILIPNAINNLKSGILNCQIKTLQKDMLLCNDSDEQNKLLQKLQKLYTIQSQLSSQLGERVVNPK